MGLLCVLGVEKYRSIRHDTIWGLIDGCKQKNYRPGDDDVQSAAYSGWKSDHQTNNILVFDLTGRIRWARLNLLGNTHDSAASVPLYIALRKSDLHFGRQGLPEHQRILVTFNRKLGQHGPWCRSGKFETVHRTWNENIPKSTYVAPNYEYKSCLARTIVAPFCFDEQFQGNKWM
jgi:hypothetical protein